MWLGLALGDGGRELGGPVEAAETRVLRVTSSVTNVPGALATARVGCCWSSPRQHD